MTLAEYYQGLGQTVYRGCKLHCPNPYHVDNTPSALFLDDAVMCYSCSKVYQLADLERFFNLPFGTLKRVTPTDVVERQAVPLFSLADILPPT